MQPHLFYYPQVVYASVASSWTQFDLCSLQHAQEQTRAIPNAYIASQRKAPIKQQTAFRSGSSNSIANSASDHLDDVKYSSAKSNEDFRINSDHDMPSAFGEGANFPQSYSVISELGAGGAGKAYLVTGKTDGKHYVAKEIVCLGDKYRAAAASYALHETRLMYLLRHPHIVQLRDFYPKSSSYFIVMEYCEQGDLSNQIDSAVRQRINFDSERIYTWWFQLLDGLECCHKHGVIHRDLKPKNIFLDRNLNIRIGDFGVSALISFPPAVERVGTVAYHAPEVHASLQYSHKSDIWSLGCIMWEAMTLKNVGSEISKFHSNRFGNLPDMYGPAAHELMALHLQADPERRADAGNLKESMLQILTGSVKSSLILRASTNAAMSVASAEKHRAWMRPKTIEIPALIVKNDEGTVGTKATSPRGNYDRAAKQSLRSTWDELNSYQANQTSSQQSSSSNSLSTTSTVRKEFFSLPDIGLSLSPGEGGEFRAWKIIELTPNKPAALSGQLSEGEYLWEVEGKVIYGLPFQLIPSMVKGRYGSDVKLGVKPGISLPVRQVVIHLDDPAGGNTISVTQGQITSDNTESPSVGSGLTASGIIPQRDLSSLPPNKLEESQSMAKRDSQRKGDNFAAILLNSSTSNMVSPQHVKLSPIFKAADSEKLASDMETLHNVNEDTRGSRPSSTNLASKDWVLSEQNNRSSGPPPAVETTGVASISGDGYYTGELLDGKPFGSGTATWHLQGHTYVGEWRNGVMHGQGTATYLNGDRYDGEWANGKRSGLGRYAHGSGDVYEGLWANERKHGLGVDTFADGRGYRGEFQDNKFAGLGAYFSMDGAVYEGDWHQGKAHGFGISTSILGGQPAFVKYIHGNLVSSEAMSSPTHFELQERVTKQSRSATAIALLARRVASSIQMKKLDPPLASAKEIEEIAGREYIPSDIPSSALAQALLLFNGIRTVTQKDSSLVVEELSDFVQEAGRERIAVSDRIQDVRHRSCSWYKEMTHEEITLYFQANLKGGTLLDAGVCSASEPPWTQCRRILLPRRGSPPSSGT